MKAPYTLALLALVGLPTLGVAQNLIDGATFFSPSSTVRNPAATSGLVNVGVTTTQTTTPTPANPVWNQGAGGMLQTRSNILGAVEIDAQLFSSTRTTGSSLVFGRGATATAEVLDADLLALLGLDTSAIAATTLNNLVSPTLVYNWSASRSVGGLDIDAGQTYRVTFDVTPAAGLPVGLLQSASFGITNPSVLGEGGEVATVLDVLGIVTIGGGPATDSFTFDFVSSTDLTSLDFSFAAQSVAGANLLPGASGVDYLTFSNMSVIAVPEPGVTTLAGVMAAGLLIRRKRR